MLLHQNIRVCAQELDRDLRGTRFNLDAAVEGTTILENWKGDLVILKKMISPRASERLSASELVVSRQPNHHTLSH